MSKPVGPLYTREQYFENIFQAEQQGPIKDL